MIPSLITIGFAYQFYQGVEVSHPIYATVFTNIISTIFLSSVVFLCSIINAIIKSCVPIVLAFYINTISYSINTVSWMVIAFLRYFLLVTAKKENEDNVIDMQKTRSVALFANWCIIIAVQIIRGLVIFLHFNNYMLFLSQLFTYN